MEFPQKVENAGGQSKSGCAIPEDRPGAKPVLNECADLPPDPGTGARNNNIGRRHAEIDRSAQSDKGHCAAHEAEGASNRKIPDQGVDPDILKRMAVRVIDGPFLGTNGDQGRGQLLADGHRLALKSLGRLVYTGGVTPGSGREALTMHLRETTIARLGERGSKTLGERNRCPTRTLSVSWPGHARPWASCRRPGGNEY